MSGMKLSFSLTNNSKKKKRNKLELAATATAVVGGVASSPSFVATMEGFEPLHTDESTNDPSYSSYNASSGYSRGPLIIPVQDDNRPSLQEQARIRRLQRDNSEASSLQEEKAAPSMVAPAHPKAEEDEEDADQAAIVALRNEAGQQQISMSNRPSLNMVIEGSQNTFQRNGSSNSTAGAAGTKRGVNYTITDHNDNDDDIPFQQELNRYAPELSVDSASYRHVPIADFGAAMLRGMGWTGQQAVGDNDTSSTTQLPRPSRLGLGATPKLDPSMAAPPTHGGNSHKRMRRQDQVQRDQQLKLQQEEYEKKRLEQIKFDKQRTIQDGSIVWVESSSMPTTATTITTRRAVIRKWQGVPGLNMCLVQFEQQQEEQQEDPVKVKKGDVRLIDREELHVRPFLERKVEPREEKVRYLGMDDCQQERIRDPDGKDQRQLTQQRSSKEQDKDHRRRDRMVDDDDEKRRRQDRKHHRDEESAQYQDRKRLRLDERSSYARTTPTSSTTTTWLIPHIRVRVISSKVGKQYYKEKGIIVDVTRNGTATLTMGNGQVIQAPERYLETALPKVGGNVCILVGEHRLAKGKLLERDSRKNRGAIQVFEDMTIVTTSLDDMAEWCGPLDDDLME